MVAGIDSIKRTFKIDIRIYDNYDGAKWMEELEENIFDTALCEVGLPGTHDSGTHTYAVEYGASPDSDLTSTISDIFDKGLGYAKDFIIRSIFERLCKCQEKSIKEQLEMGIRYLDLRVAYHEESGTYSTCHGVYCENMDVIKNQINDFLNENQKVLEYFNCLQYL